jgi:hypothetical protein
MVMDIPRILLLYEERRATLANTLHFSFSAGSVAFSLLSGKGIVTPRSPAHTETSYICLAQEVV